MACLFIRPSYVVLQASFVTNVTGVGPKCQNTILPRMAGFQAVAVLQSSYVDHVFCPFNESLFILPSLLILLYIMQIFYCASPLSFSLAFHNATLNSNINHSNVTYRKSIWTALSDQASECYPHQSSTWCPSSQTCTVTVFNMAFLATTRHCTDIKQ